MLTPLKHKYILCQSNHFCLRFAGVNARLCRKTSRTSEITIEASLKFYEAGNKIAVKHIKISSNCWCNFTSALKRKGLLVFSLSCHFCCRTFFLLVLLLKSTACVPRAALGLCLKVWLRRRSDDPYPPADTGGQPVYSPRPNEYTTGHGCPQDGGLRGFLLRFQCMEHAVLKLHCRRIKDNQMKEKGLESGVWQIGFRMRPSSKTTASPRGHNSRFETWKSVATVSQATWKG